MKTFTVWVTTQGRAQITAPTKAEARRKAERGVFDPGTVRLQPISAQVSTIEEKP